MEIFILEKRLLFLNCFKILVIIYDIHKIVSPSNGLGLILRLRQAPVCVTNDLN